MQIELRPGRAAEPHPSRRAFRLRPATRRDLDPEVHLSMKNVDRTQQFAAACRNVFRQVGARTESEGVSHLDES